MQTINSHINRKILNNKFNLIYSNLSENIDIQNFSKCKYFRYVIDKKISQVLQLFIKQNVFTQKICSKFNKNI